MGAAERGQLGAVFGNAFLADRPGLGREVELRETRGDVGGVVLARAALFGAEQLHALQHGVAGHRRQIGRAHV